MSSLFSKEDQSFKESPQQTKMPGWEGDTPPVPGTVVVGDISTCPVCAGRGQEYTGICGKYLQTNYCPNQTHSENSITVLGREVCSQAIGALCSLCKGKGKVRPA